MNSKEKIGLAWSGGKDSALALHALRASGRWHALSLLTTVTEGCERISMHGVRVELLEEQSQSLGIPVRQVRIPKDASNSVYEARMAKALGEFKAQGVQSVAFGDIFLEDLRVYREKNLARLGLRGVFPLWKKDTPALARDFVRQGFKAVVVCADTRALDAAFAGAEIDEAFFAKLPAEVDPCGENGEFHSFVYDGPGWSLPVRFTRGERVVREGRFCFQDLLPDPKKPTLANDKAAPKS
ncbi:MAG: adenine nucleotide alpha hydrolase [Elusimicrobia bacterium]|nr:adenine nucleotide alpha hydrolase [Elusimicrobiota bacterium]